MESLASPLASQRSTTSSVSSVSSTTSTSSVDVDQTDPSSPEWQRYYARASRRRRAIRKRMGGRPPLEAHRRRRNAIEVGLMFGSLALLGALLVIFHSALTR